MLNTTSSTRLVENLSFTMSYLSKLYSTSLVLFLCSGLCSSLFGQAGSNGDQSNRGGDLAYGETEIIRTFNPYLRTVARGPSDRIYSLIYEPLVRFDADQPEGQRYVPLLAMSWEIISDQVMRFKLNEGITWHDGQPFTARDVAFTFRFIQLRAPEQIKAKLGHITAVDAVDAFTVDVTCDVPATEEDVLGLLSGFWIIPEHMFENYIDRPGESSLSRKGIGTGPYMLVGSRTIEGHITLQDNPGYWSEVLPNIEEIKMRYIPDENNLIQSAFFNATQLVLETPPDKFALLNNSGQFNMQPYASYTIHVFGYNSANAILANASVRRAISHAVDRKGMLDQWYLGQGSLLAGPFVPTSPYYDPQVRGMEYNPETAQQLLDEAGFKDMDGDGVREQTSDGQKLSFRLIVPTAIQAGNTTVHNIAASYVEYLKAIQIEVEPVFMTVDSYIEEMAYSRDFDIIWTRWTFDVSYDISELFYSENNYPGGSNFINYNNPDVDQLILEFRQSRDADERRQTMYDLQALLARDVPYTFLYTIDSYAAVHTMFTNVKIDPYYFFTNFSDWWILPDFRGIN